jgi:hypothetical protein
MRIALKQRRNSGIHVAHCRVDNGADAKVLSRVGSGKQSILHAHTQHAHWRIGQTGV